MSDSQSLCCLSSNIQRIYDVVKFSYTQLNWEGPCAFGLGIGPLLLFVSVTWTAVQRTWPSWGPQNGLSIVFWQRTPLFSRQTSMLMWETMGTAFMIFFPSLDFCASHSASITNTMYTIRMSISAHGLKALTLGSRVKTGGELSTN